MRDFFQAFLHARGCAGRPPPPLPGRRTFAEPPDPYPSSFGCPHCQTDLQRLPPTARFCPRCGAGIKGLRAGQARPAPPPPAVRSSNTTDGGGASLVLQGYANAMYNLGRRYETGVGAARNPEEAVRCYFKAARLGNESAVAHLVPRCLQVEAPPPPLAGPPPLPGMRGD